MTDKIKYWWSDDKKWFCIIANDGVNESTISLTPEEASLLSMTAAHPIVADDRAAGERGTQPRVIDDDDCLVSVTFNGKELRGWSYKDDAERRTKIFAAREYVEGWCDGRGA